METLPEKKAKLEGTAGDVPAFVQKNYKPVPPTPEDASQIPYIIAIIQESNASTKKSVRQTLYALYNMGLQLLSRPLPKGGSGKPAAGSQYGASNDSARDRFSMSVAVVTEMMGNHHMIPRSDTIAMVLNACDREGLQQLGLSFFDVIVEHAAHAKVGAGEQLKESVITCAIRLVIGSGVADAENKAFQLLKSVPRVAVKRRMIVPLLKRCAESGSLALAARVLAFVQDSQQIEEVTPPPRDNSFPLEDDGAEGKIELWDADFMSLATCAERAIADGGASCAHAVKELLVTILEQMREYHPMVGKHVAEALMRVCHAISGSAGVAQVPTFGPKEGLCSSCGAHLEHFQFDVVECESLMRDIVEKLVVPRTRATGHHLTPVRPPPSDDGGNATSAPEVPEAEVAARFEAFREFQREIESGSASSATVILDGANLGYYGLNSWYAEAKRALLIRRGTPPSEIRSKDLQVHLPVDVPLKMEHIQMAIDSVVQHGLRPVVILHERHLDPRNLFDANAMLVDKWRSAGYLLASPGFLNDDYCWLYASIARTKALLEHPPQPQLDSSAARRFAADRCFVVSNDLMRDHHFCLLSQRKFLRWRQAHRVTYKVAYDAALQSSHMRIKFPISFSMWVQRAAFCATQWHLPVVASSNIIDQSTNNPAGTSADHHVANSTAPSGGEDHCDHWLCLNLLPTK